MKCSCQIKYYHAQEHANAEVLKMSTAKMLPMMTLLETKGSKWVLPGSSL